MPPKEAEPNLNKDNRPKWGPLGAFLVTILAYIASQAILILPLALIAYIKPGQNAQNYLDNTTWLELALTGLSSITILGVLWLYLKHRKSGFKNLGFRRIKWPDFGWLSVGVVSYFVVVAVVLALASHIPGFNANQSQSIGYQGATGWQLTLAFIGLVVLPPLAEEMLFRGFLYRGLATRIPKIIAALITSGLFALVHFQWNVSLDVFVLSLVLIGLYEKTKNLWVCVGLHAIKNGIAFLALFVFVSR
jgi:membrane protease YdiL (CAAX protease family)